CCRRCSVHLNLLKQDPRSCVTTNALVGRLHTIRRGRRSRIYWTLVSIAPCRVKIDRYHRPFVSSPCFWSDRKCEPLRNYSTSEMYLLPSIQAMHTVAMKPMSLPDLPP